MKKLLLLPLVLLFVVGCGKFSGLEGKRVIYGREFKGPFGMVKDRNGDGPHEEIWFVKHSKNTITIRNIVAEWEVTKNEIIWIKKHPDQLPMPIFTSVDPETGLRTD